MSILSTYGTQQNLFHRRMFSEPSRYRHRFLRIWPENESPCREMDRNTCQHRHCTHKRRGRCSRVTKKFPEQTKGCHVIDTEVKRIKALKWLDVEDVWGIGRRNAAKLRAIGVRQSMGFCQLATIRGVEIDDHHRLELTKRTLRHPRYCDGTD